MAALRSMGAVLAMLLGLVMALMLATPGGAEYQQ